jgi:predicted polyphosphate/ATP-dependent NAD kinase
MQSASKKTSIGVIANPYSSRDVRRLISSATSIQTGERANIVERIIVSLTVFGIDKVYMMPDKGGIAAHLLRNLGSLQRLKKMDIPEIEFLDIPITSTAEDSERAARILIEKGVDAVLILGGDGTHRVVAKEIGDIPMASISTGTNNAFPKFHEATLIGMGMGLYLKGIVPAETVLNRNKVIHVTVNNETRDLALVDLAITNDQWIGARALWHMENLKELYLTFCEPTAIGMSSVGGLLNPISRTEPYGLKMVTSSPDACDESVNCPILPGLFEEIGIKSSDKLELNTPYKIETKQGVIALDGEREIEFSKNDNVVIELKNDGPVTIDINLAIELAASQGAFVKQRNVKKNDDLIYFENKYLEVAA